MSLQALLGGMDPDRRVDAFERMTSEMERGGAMTGSQRRAAGIRGIVQSMRDNPNLSDAEQRRLRTVERSLTRLGGMTKSARNMVSNAALAAVTPEEEGGGARATTSPSTRESTAPPGVDPRLYKRYQKFQARQKEQEMLDEMDSQYYRRVAAAGRGAGGIGGLPMAPSTAMRLRRGRSLGQASDFRLPSLRATESAPNAVSGSGGTFSLAPSGASRASLDYGRAIPEPAIRNALGQMRGG